MPVPHMRNRRYDLRKRGVSTKRGAKSPKMRAKLHGKMSLPPLFSITFRLRTSMFNISFAALFAILRGLAGVAAVGWQASRRAARRLAQRQNSTSRRAAYSIAQRSDAVKRKYAPSSNPSVSSPWHSL
jgi:hypothetical protein